MRCVQRLEIMSPIHPIGFTCLARVLSCVTASPIDCNGTMGPGLGLAQVEQVRRCMEFTNPMVAQIWPASHVSAEQLNLSYGDPALVGER